MPSTSEAPQKIASVRISPAQLILVALGGGLGTAARALLDFWAGPVGENSPFIISWSTGAANLIGTFILGLLTGIFAARGDFGLGSGTITRAARRWKLLLGTGFCGAFTTYSAFALGIAQSLNAPSQQGWLSVLAQAVGLVIAGLGMAFLGYYLGYYRGNSRGRSPASKLADSA